MKIFIRILINILLVLILGCGKDITPVNQNNNYVNYDSCLTGTWNVIGFFSTDNFYIGTWVSKYDSSIFLLNSDTFKISKPDTSIFRNLFAAGDYLYTFVNTDDTVGVQFVQDDYHKIKTYEIHVS